MVFPIKTRWIAIGLSLLVAVPVALSLWRKAEDAGPARPAVQLSCPDPVLGCATRIAGRAVRLGMVGPLKALRPFQLWVTVPDAKKMQASFTMVGMNMGFNRYVLIPDAAGIFHAQVTLPTCVSGRRDWVMTLDIDGEDRLTVPFTTEPAL